MSKRYSIFITVLFCAFIGVFFVANLLTPDREFSPLENRYLAQKPVLNENSFDLWNGNFGDFLSGASRGNFFSGKFMTDYETYITDQFVGRDMWIAVKAGLEVASGKQENKNVYLCKNDTLIPHFTQPDAERVQNNLNYVNKLVDNVDIPVYFGLIPGKVSVWRDRLPAHAPNASEEEIIAQARESTSANWVDMDAAMRDHADEDIYYRLDHHWTSLGAYYGYAAILETMGATAPTLDSYRRETVSTDFNGTTFSSSGVRWMKPDSIDRFASGEGVTVTVYPKGTAEEGALYHPEKLLEKDKYTYFMGGNTPLSVLKTAEADAPKLLVIRDSYSDSLAPFLTDSFSEIHLFDPRYNKTPISQYVAENGIDQVLVLYSVANFVSDSNFFVLGQ